MRKREREREKTDLVLFVSVDALMVMDRKSEGYGIYKEHISLTKIVS